MIVLAIEASAQVASVAVQRDEMLMAEQMINGKLTHSETLMPMVQSVMCQAELEPNDLDMLAVTVGPGSFTGLRIGAATVKGLALGLDIPVMPLPTLEVLAYGAVLADELLVPIMDARRGQVYAALYRRKDDALGCVQEAAVLTVEDLIQRLGEQEGPCVVLGDGIPPYGERLRETLGPRVKVAPPHLRYLRAGAAAALALAHCREGMLPVRGDDIELVYLRKPQAEREREARLQREALP
ncbi:tRNA (adenosine(37)-N6)-threonylcarbamoyltransferase complex dimerization subunit type 1 TsaB [Bianquea renquensis]|uniref:tRNA (Adenosine(37)-N6)-threonylcarbamoyltransferase complex dimerization subunit type 1 TsaB n=1 Tax=Bianquea renquensis TaxID=2763661 RepID=A0A926I2C5_9FIRM|nr:tRNA (adenosine(37)-N6)-threonylcarbamoyltransferase complex dimerization subunit type 1 TsaB [Bianquea renquensis]